MVRYSIDFKLIKRQFNEWFFYNSSFFVAAVIIYDCLAVFMLITGIIFKDFYDVKEALSILATTLLVTIVLIINYLRGKKVYIENFKNVSNNGQVDYGLIKKDNILIIENYTKGTKREFNLEDIKKTYKSKNTFIVVFKNKQSILFPIKEEILEILES